MTHFECGNIAFYLTKKPHSPEDITRDIVRDFNGNIPAPEDIIICFSCKKYINLFNENKISEVHWTDWFVVN